MILGYHRVGEGGWDPAGLTIRPERFEQQLERLIRFGTVVPLARVIAHLGGAPLPRRAVALTFDDGYRDNLTVLLPLLERYQVPATVFITTGSPGKYFWWHELTALLDPSNPLPERLEVESLGPPVPTADRHQLYRQVANRLARMPARSRLAAMDDLRIWAGVDPGPPDGAHALTHAEIEELARSPLIEIGAHTVTHPRLVDLLPAEARAEVEGSLATLRRLTGGPVAGFSYPEGAVTAAVRGTVASSGATYACSSQPGTISVRTDVLGLPRLWPGDFGGDRLSRWIHARWFGL
jgi:peptidoglycan/xylan/chitin deacetylase (PgdA/CDA1 family)